MIREPGLNGFAAAAFGGELVAGEAEPFDGGREGGGDGGGVVAVVGVEVGAEENRFRRDEVGGAAVGEGGVGVDLNFEYTAGDRGVGGERGADGGFVGEAEDEQAEFAEAGTVDEGARFGGGGRCWRCGRACRVGRWGISRRPTRGRW